MRIGVNIMSLVRCKLTRPLSTASLVRVEAEVDYRTLWY